MPDTYKTDSIADGLTRFIHRSEATLKPVEVVAEEDMIVLKDVFYLLADFNFKSRELEKAMVFYMKDLCFNPRRFDSWDGVGIVE